MKLNKNLIFAIFVIIALILFETMMYEAARFIGTSPYILTSHIDALIPFISYFIYPYILWYLMLFFVPLIIYLHSPKSFYGYAITLFITILIAFCIFIIFPTTVQRPEITGSSFTDSILKLIYNLDEPALCCLPSMHCAVCFLFIIYSYKTKNLNRLYKACILVLSFAVVVSTLFIKQHVIYDILLSFIIVIITTFFTDKFKLWSKVMSKINSFLDAPT